MRKYVFAAAAAFLTLAGCHEKEDALEPIDFSSAVYTVYNGGEAGIALAIVNPAPARLSIPVSVSGASSGFELSSDAVVIEPGQIAGSVTLKDVSLAAGTNLTVSFTPPAGYTAGRIAQAKVAYDAREALTYSFTEVSGTFEEGMEVSIVLQGVRSGDGYAAEKTFTVPAWITGNGGESDGSKEVAFREGGFIVQEGSNIATGHVIRSHNTDLEKPLTAQLGVDLTHPRFYKGPRPAYTLTIPRTEKKDKE